MAKAQVPRGRVPPASNVPESPSLGGPIMRPQLPFTLAPLGPCTRRAARRPAVHAAGPGPFVHDDKLGRRRTPATHCAPDAFHLSNGRVMPW